jgi:ATP-dependent Clp protease adaptor protein ClpS
MNGAENASAVRPKRVRRQRTSTSKKPRKLPPFNVVLLNDDDHTYEYVIEMLRALFGVSESRAFELARQVDTGGRAVLLTTTKEHAEFKRDQVHAYGRDTRIAACRGSMSARIEPALTGA